MKKEKKFKLPSKKILTKAIQDIEESDILYKYMADFGGIAIENVKYDEDELKEDGECVTINYTATVDEGNKKTTYLDCSVTFKELKGFIK